MLRGAFVKLKTHTWFFLKKFWQRIHGYASLRRDEVIACFERHIYILWKSQIRHLGNLVIHDISDLNDITYKKGVFISQVNRLNAGFPFCFMWRQRSPIRNPLLFLLWVPDLGFIWETCQSAKCRMEQGCAENFKSAIQNSSAVATFDNQWKIFQKSPLQPSSQICKRIFFSENIYVSFIGAKAKTRVTGA